MGWGGHGDVTIGSAGRLPRHDLARYAAYIWPCRRAVLAGEGLDMSVTDFHIPDRARLDAASRYDGVSISLHWATALLVLLQFALAESWGFFPRPVHHVMISLHMSFGLLLAGVILLRIIWRWRFGRSLPPTGHGLLDAAAKALHYVLYVLVAAEIPLGFATRWTDNHALSFFGFLVPSPFGAFSKAAGGVVDQIHDLTAWAIMGLVAVHALAALGHHYLLKDGVLRRMLPG
jgi:cytochrome b561